MIGQVDQRAASAGAVRPGEPLGDLAPVASLAEEPVQERDPRPASAHRERVQRPGWRGRHVATLSREGVPTEDSGALIPTAGRRNVCGGGFLMADMIRLDDPHTVPTRFWHRLD